MKLRLDVDGSPEELARFVGILIEEGLIEEDEDPDPRFVSLIKRNFGENIFEGY